MMTLDEKIAALEAELAELKNQQQDKWPRVGIQYWTAHSGKVIDYIWDDDKFDNDMLAIGSALRTKEEAERELDARKVIAELRAQPGRRPFKLGWQNYCLVFDPSDISPLLDDGKFCEYAWQQINFETEDQLEAAIETVGKDRILAAMKWLSEKP